VGTWRGIRMYAVIYSLGLVGMYPMCKHPPGTGRVTTASVAQSNRTFQTE